LKSIDHGLVPCHGRLPLSDESLDRFEGYLSGLHSFVRQFPGLHGAAGLGTQKGDGYNGGGGKPIPESHWVFLQQ
jgi:hypothetical protein